MRHTRDIATGRVWHLVWVTPTLNGNANGLSLQGGTKLESRIAPCIAGYSYQGRRDRGDRAILASRWAILPCLLFGLVAAGCTSNPNGQVQDEWDKAISTLGMTAVYPIDEDVQVGDLFLYAPTVPVTPAANDAGNTRFRLTRIASIVPRDCLVDALRRQHAGRLRIEPMPADTKGHGNFQPRPPSTIHCSSIDSGGLPRTTTAREGKSPVDVANTLNVEAPVRMRRAAIPGFTIATTIQGQAGVGAFIGRVAATLGLAAAANTAITVTLNDVEELSLDAGAARSLEEEQTPYFLGHAGTPERLLEYIHVADDDLAKSFCEGDFQQLDNEHVHFVIANRVMYAHTIEYAYNTDSQFGSTLLASVAATNAAAAGGIPAPPASADAPVAPQPAPQSPQPPAQGQAPAPTPAQVQARAQQALEQTQQALATRMAAINTLLPTAPGIKARFGIGHLGTSTLAITYDEPLAIGIGSPILVTVSELMSLYSQVIAGQYPRLELASDGRPSPRYLALRKQYLGLQAPLRKSFTNMVARCTGILPATGHDGAGPVILRKILADATR